jgi:hypothetical protein
MSVYGSIDMNEFYSEMSKGELIDRVRRIEKVISDEHARAAAAEARADALQTKLDAANEDAEAILVALKLILDCVDYTSGSCGLTEMVGGALPAQIIRKARAALASHEARKGGEG